jgi:RNA polymerase sigma-70 factor (ECF subfamily)
MPAEKSMPAKGDVSRLLSQMTAGDELAQAELMPLVYDELRRLARSYMRWERTDHTLQPTALVNEAYLRLAGGSPVSWKDRAHFFAVAAQLMRRILVDHARARRAGKRVGDGQRISLDAAAAFPAQKGIDPLALNEALDRLEKRDPRQARIVEMRFFGGLSEDEIAQHLGISARTVRRDWGVARAWLYKEVRKGVAETPADGPTEALPPPTENRAD